MTIRLTAEQWDRYQKTLRQLPKLALEVAELRNLLDRTAPDVPNVPMALNRVRDLETLLKEIDP